MNLPNKLTMGRIILAIIILVLLIMPWYQLGIVFPTLTIFGKIIVDTKYLIAGVLFLIAAITDLIDGYVARSSNQVTDFGKVLDAIADKVLVNGVLIILAYQGFIHVIVPVIIITRDTIVDAIKMESGNKGRVVAASMMGKLKTVCMMVGIILMLFYNLPFEIISIPLADILILLACVFSVISGCQYYFQSKELFNKKSN